MHIRAQTGRLATDSAEFEQWVRPGKHSFFVAVRRDIWQQRQKLWRKGFHFLDIS
ncbi:hypothetical protein KSX_51310 [Ktedonospora formicarum]|uniref:Uncharacterized protein n=1 Tax=Ktedonospora formicarum TaxID=2778364 RepID=A0A8J3I6Y3_9CHLR|nr:hypothetical protein KSX_51310 [Ktedonospora formicarum]